MSQDTTSSIDGDETFIEIIIYTLVDEITHWQLTLVDENDNVVPAEWDAAMEGVGATATARVAVKDLAGVIHVYRVTAVRIEDDN